MTLDNDTRGWIMTALSGIACVVGASVICVDVIVRLLPGKKDFRIQDSNVFLSSSLSLSFGVMLFSALYNMLPNSKSSLMKGGFSASAAVWIMLACFLGGVIGIQVITRILHRYIPSHVVDCDHTHDDVENQDKPGDPETQEVHPRPGNGHASHGHTSHSHNGRPRMHQGSASDSNLYTSNPESAEESGSTTPAVYGTLDGTHSQVPRTQSSRPALHAQLSAQMSKLVSVTKPNGDVCDEFNTCYGFSERPCGSDCFRNVSARGGSRAPTVNTRSPAISAPGTLTRSTTTPNGSQVLPTERQPLLSDVSEESSSSATPPPPHPYSSHTSRPPSLHPSKSQLSLRSHAETTHHHHVPTNAFLSIGLQTSIAIALHKLPEGFITYATNHANPSLGVSVFLALFIHNITEGFAMALPLYLAIGSRWKAMFWSSLLGGVSQPCGAGIAALWFHFAAQGEQGGVHRSGPGEAVYGGMFAVTAGIMASVALQLFSESLDLTHNRDLCMVFAFVGMGVLGVSSALTV